VQNVLCEGTVWAGKARMGGGVNERLKRKKSATWFLAGDFFIFFFVPTLLPKAKTLLCQKSYEQGFAIVQDCSLVK